MRSWTRVPTFSDSRRPPARARASRVRSRPRRHAGSLLTALNEAGRDAEATAGPAADHDPHDRLPRFIGNARRPQAGRPSRARTPQWVRNARRARWRARLHNALAWTATFLVVGLIVWGALQILASGTPVPGPPLEPGPETAAPPLPRP